MGALINLFFGYRHGENFAAENIIPVSFIQPFRQSFIKSFLQLFGNWARCQ